MIQNIEIDCTTEELDALFEAIPDPAQRYAILRKAIPVKPILQVATNRVVMRPEKPVAEFIAVIKLEGNLLTAALSEKIESFRQIVKFQCGMEFDWSGSRRWYRRLNQFAGEPLHRAVELCHRLLAAGFVIEVDTGWVEDIQSANYQPERTRWIKRVVAGKYTDWFSVSWGRLDDYYEVARRLPGSRYDGDKHQVVIPVACFNAMLDFAEQHDFDLSPGAIEIMDTAKAKRDAAILAVVETPKHRKRVVAKDVRPILSITKEEEVADEFADNLA